EMKNSKMHGGFVGCSSCISVHDSEFYGINNTNFTYNVMGFHTHIIYEDYQSSPGGWQIYNNLIHDSSAGLNISVPYNSNIFNNVLYRIYNNAAIQLENVTGDTAGNVGNVYNNIYDMSAQTVLAPCVRYDGPQGLGTLNYKNNICIPNGSGSAGGFNVATLNQSNNHLTMSTSEAATYGFTAANKYFPTSLDPNVAGKGTNP